jgi:hypothetical protein
MSKIRKEVLPDMEADVPVEPSGGLDLQRVNELWGLEKCLVCRVNEQVENVRSTDRLVAE